VRVGNGISAVSSTIEKMYDRKDVKDVESTN